MRLVVLRVACSVMMCAIARASVWGQVVEKEVVIEPTWVQGEQQIEMLGEVVQFLFLNAGVGQAEGVPEREKEAIDRRLKEHAGAWLEWVEHVCGLSAEQKTRVAAMAKELQESKFTAKRSRPQITAYGLSESMPVIFPSKNGLAKTYANALRGRLNEGEILTSEQKVLLEKAIIERVAAHHGVYCGRVVNLFDERLCFLPEQRAQIYESMLKSRRKLTGALYSFGQSYFLPYEPTSRVHQYFKKHLSPEQSALLEKLDGSESYAIFYGEDLVGTKEVMEADIANRAEILRLVIAVRMKLYQNMAAKNGGVLRPLEIASKGVHQQVMEKWRKECLSQLQQYEDGAMGMQQDISIVLQAPNFDLERNGLWKTTTKKLSLSEVADRRTRAINDAEVGYRVVLLDDELWLRPEQQVALRKLMEERVGGDICRNMEQDAVSLKAFIEMAHALHFIQDGEASAILSESQMAVWRGLKERLFVKEGRIHLMVGAEDADIGGLSTGEESEEAEEEEELDVEGQMVIVEGMKIMAGQAVGVDFDFNAVNEAAVQIVTEPKSSRPHAWEKGGRVTVGARFYEGDAARVVGVAVDVLLEEVEEHEHYVLMTLRGSPEEVEQIKKVAGVSEYCFEVMPFREEQRGAFEGDLKIEEVLGETEVYRAGGVKDWGLGAKSERLEAPGKGELPRRE
ncbi:hypothetical protein [Lacunimicrobium album]